MVRLVKGRVFVTAILVWALFIPLVLIFDRADVFAITGGLTLVASAAVVHAYWPAMVITAKGHRSEMDYIDFLTLGIMCSWFAISVRILYILWLRFYYDIPEPLSSLWIAFLQYVNFTGALLHLSARRVLRNSVPTTSAPRIAWVVILGIALATFLAWTN